MALPLIGIGLAYAAWKLYEGSSSPDTNKVTGDMALTCMMSVTMNNIQECGTAATGGMGGGNINLDIITEGNLVINGMTLEQTTTNVMECFYNTDNQTDMNQSITATLTAMAENNIGIGSALGSATGKNVIFTKVMENATQKVTINNIQQCGIGSSNINVDINTKGNAYIGNFLISNDAYSYLTCVYNSANMNDMSQELAAVINDSAGNLKKNPLSGISGIIMIIVGLMFFAALIVGGFLLFRITDGMFKSNGGPSIAQQVAPMLVAAKTGAPAPAAAAIG